MDILKTFIFFYKYTLFKYYYNDIWVFIGAIKVMLLFILFRVMVDQITLGTRWDSSPRVDSHLGAI